MMKRWTSTAAALLAAALLWSPLAAAQTANLSEIRIDQPGSDNDEYFELAGTPGTSLAGLTYLVIGDGTGGSGVIEAVVDLTGQTIPASGYFVAAESTFTIGTADMTTSLNFENSDNVTHLLVSGFTGANGDDLDTDDDGVLDVIPWTSVVDCVALIETVGSGDQVYCTTQVGPDGSYVPGHVFFCPSGWEIGQFDPSAGDDTPGAANACAGPPGGATLLLSEIAVTPTDGEFIEIHNPTSSVIDLSDVYLTDATYAGGGVYYYNIVTGSNAGGGGYGDFHARFPDGASIAPGEYQTIALAGSDAFFATYGSNPTYELYEDGASADAIPDMREALPGSINGQGGLTNSGEVVILYQWDGQSDLVQDLDYAVWGDKAEAVDKSGISVDGPDADTTPSTYANDTPISGQDVITATGHATGMSWHRIDMDEGAESKSGGNGATGHDETSEDLSNTWAEKTPTPGSGVPVQPPKVLLLSEIVVTPTAGEMIEIENPTSETIELENYYITDATFAGGGVYYYNIVTGSNAGGGGFGDFHARFPEGATIAPGEHQTIALNGSDNFQATYGVAPTYELYEDAGSADAIPDMREALPGSINGQGGLTNSGEVVILYYWDGQSDLVTDIDYAVWGDKAEAVDKTGVSIDGPDADSTPSTYLDDTAISAQDVVATGAHASGSSFQRVDPTEGTETSSGGNGVNGHDETSENLSITWTTAAVTPGDGQPTGWVINEINADPDATAGDANGDGTADTQDDEFVEIVNATGADQDISGWTLADGYAVRHVFPAGTVVPAGCSVVVFGGGPLLGDFGGSLGQEASTGGLGLNNGGDTVTLATGSGIVLAQVTYGSIAGNNQSITLDPDVTGTTYVQHSTATGSGGTLFSPGTRVDGSRFSGCATPPGNLTIAQIQGSGMASPWANQTVTTTGNVVTAVGPAGFFMQTPDGSDDGNPETSEGIYVYTGSAPGVAVGDAVDVSGVVVEFYEMTEFSGNPSVTVTSSGNPLPTPVVFDATNPSPNQPQAENAKERYEGMLVSFTGTATGPTDRYGDLPVVAGPQRAYRGPGIAYPGLPGLPVWDGNPEVFEVKPEALGLPSANVPAGAAVAATGPFAFGFGDYQVWPTAFSFTGTPQAIPVRDRAPGELSVGSQNMLQLFDDQDDPSISEPVPTTQEYQDRLAKSSLLIRNVLKAPDVLVLQEVENLSTLQDLAARIQADDPSVVYAAHLQEGNDPGGIDTGLLVRDTVQVTSVTQVGASETFSYAGSTFTLWDRPPLVLEGNYVANGTPFPITVVGVHLRSRLGIEGDGGGFARQKRFEQAQWLANYLQSLQSADPAIHLVVAGDFNSFEFTDGYVDVMGMVTGNPDPAGALIPAPDLVDPDLANHTLDLPAADRYSFVSAGTAEAIDHILTSSELASWVRGFAFARANADAPAALAADPSTPLRTSDHDGAVLFLMTDADGDGIADDVDTCDDLLAPEITGSSPTPLVFHGTATDCSGIASVALDPASSGLVLVIDSGVPGDPTWTFTVQIADGADTGTGSVIVTDQSGQTSTLAVNLTRQGVPIPATGPEGTLLLVLLLAAAGALLLRRST